MPGVLIAGGGLAGAAAACALARSGADVTLVEREAAPVHKICGEFLSVEAQAYLQNLGFDVAALGGHAIARLRLVQGDDCVETQLPFQGIGVTRKALDEVLLNHAAASGAKVSRGRAVSLDENTDGLALAFSDGEVMRPATLFLATGKHDVRGLRRLAPPAKQLVGFKMYFRLGAAARAALAGHITLLLFRGGYAGLQLVETGEANLCLLVDRERLRTSGGKWPSLLDGLCSESRHLANALAGASPTLAQPLTIYRVPYGFVHQAMPGDPPGLFRLGDQAAVIPSFTGDGMSIALHSAALASAMFLRGENAAAYHRRLANDVAAQIGLAGWLYRMAHAPATNRLFFQLARRLPGSLSYAARLTRIPDRARAMAM
jgi:flavin-dependent dehydrogenase